MARNIRSDRGVVFGTQSMSNATAPKVIYTNPTHAQSAVNGQFGTSLSKSPVYLGRQKTMRR